MLERVKLRSLLLLFGGLLFAACASETSSLKGSIDIPVSLSSREGQNVPFDLSEMIDSVRYIQVQEEDFVIGAVKDIKMVNGRFYLSEEGTNSIIVIDSVGKVIHRLQHAGRASNEWVSLYAFDVNPVNEEITVFDQSGRKLVVYSSEGEFLRSVPMESEYAVFRDFAVTASGTYLFFKPDREGDYPCGLVELDSQGAFIRQLADIEKDFFFNMILEPPRYFSRLSDHSLCVSGTQDRNEVYRLGADGSFSTPFRKVYDIALSNTLRHTKDMAEIDLEDSSFYFEMMSLELDRWLIFTIMRPDGTRTCFYDKAHHVIHTVTDADDFVKSPFETVSFQRGAGSCMLAFLEAGVRESDCPVIALYYIK